MRYPPKRGITILKGKGRVRGENGVVSVLMRSRGIGKTPIKKVTLWCPNNTKIIKIDTKEDDSSLSLTKRASPRNP